MNNWGLLAATVPFLIAGDNAKAGLEVYRNLLALELVPIGLRTQWLKEGIKVAHAAVDMRQAIEWENEKTRLVAEIKK